MATYHQPLKLRPLRLTQYLQLIGGQPRILETEHVNILIVIVGQRPQLLVGDLAAS